MNSYYEKFITTGEVKCIDEEIPFEIPDGWKWVRMGFIGDWGAGTTPAKGNAAYYGGNILWLRTGELNDGIVYDTEIKVTQKALAECSLRINKIGDVLIAMYGATIGKVAIVGKELTTNQACCACTPFGVYNWFLFYFLMGSKEDFVKKGEGGAQPNISREKLIHHLMPLPPLAEQRRIVEKTRDVLLYIKQYENSQKSLNALNGNIRTLLKKSILQEAIQGRLVPQIAEEGTAQDLLERIKQEKLKLIKEGKLKKSALTNNVIFKGDDNRHYEKIGNAVTYIENEIPFEIPNSWQWVRVKNLVQLNPKNEAENKIDAAFIPMEKISASYDSNYTFEIAKWGTIKKGYTHFANGDVAFAKITPCFQNKKSAILEKLPNGIGAGTTELKVLRIYGETIDRWYLLYFLKSPQFIDAATFKGTANQQRIVNGYLEEKLFPLPPYNEQRRIVQKINELFSKL